MLYQRCVFTLRTTSLINRPWAYSYKINKFACCNLLHIELWNYDFISYFSLSFWEVTEPWAFFMVHILVLQHKSNLKYPSFFWFTISMVILLCKSFNICFILIHYFFIYDVEFANNSYKVLNSLNKHIKKGWIWKDLHNSMKTSILTFSSKKERGQSAQT